VTGAYKSVLKNFVGVSLGALAVIAGGTALAGKSALFAALFAYMLSFLFVGSNFYVIRNIRGEDHSSFYRQFFITLAVRFVLIIALLILILETIKIHQIYFTVSFIISYIFHSIIEVISINLLLETDN